MPPRRIGGDPRRLAEPPELAAQHHPRRGGADADSLGGKAAAWPPAHPAPTLV
jgi:hypothetical protein